MIIKIVENKSDMFEAKLNDIVFARYELGQTIVQFDVAQLLDQLLIPEVSYMLSLVSGVVEYLHAQDIPEEDSVISIETFLVTIERGNYGN